MSNRDWKHFFTASDAEYDANWHFVGSIFDPRIGGQKVIHESEAKGKYISIERASSILREELERAPKVSRVWDPIGEYEASGGWFRDDENESPNATRSHTARLVDIEEIK